MGGVTGHPAAKDQQACRLRRRLRLRRLLRLRRPRYNLSIYVGGRDMSAESGEGEHVVTLETEERAKECGSRGELGDVGVLAGGGEENQDQEVRA